MWRVVDLMHEGHGYEEMSSRTQDTADFGKRLGRFPQVLQHLHHRHGSAYTGCDRKLVSIADNTRPHVPVRVLVVLLSRMSIHPDIQGRGLHELAQASLAATNIEQNISRPHTAYKAVSEFATGTITATVEIATRKRVTDRSESAGNQLPAPPGDDSPSIAVSDIASTAR
jgi:hypothetical protein